MRRFLARQICQRLRAPRAYVFVVNVPAAVLVISLVTSIAISLFFTTAAYAAASAPVLVIDMTGMVNPALAAHMREGMARATREGAQLVVLAIDTPGGLETAMRMIVKDILASSVPVAAFVSPPGARAASAGTYIVMASHIAAMAPGTNLGAATPVALGGGYGKESSSASKAINDDAAYLRSLATLRARNTDWAERAVRAAESLPATAAQRERVIDLIAADLPDLLRQLDGRSIRLPQHEVQLRLSKAVVNQHPQPWRVQLLSALSDPGIALILIMLGLTGIIAEILIPGIGLPGLLGTTSLVVGLYALQMLPANTAGLALLALGAGLLLAEIFLPSGLLGISGGVALVGGTLILMDEHGSSSAVPVALLLTTAIAIALAMAVLASMALRSRRQLPVSGDASLIGTVGEIVDDRPGNARALLHGELWQVRCDQALQRGQRVQVTAREGLLLDVIPADTSTRRSMPND